MLAGGPTTVATGVVTGARVVYRVAAVTEGAATVTVVPVTPAQEQALE